MIVSWIKTVLAIAYTALMACLALLSVPVNRGGRAYHGVARLWARGILWICGVKLSVAGTEKVDFSRSYIYVANHASMLDIPALIAGIPDQIRFLYKRELGRIPLFGWALNAGKTYIAIDRVRGQDALQSLDAAADKIRSGASAILFAEGTRTSDGALQPFKRGAFALAVRAGVAVVPVTILGSYAVLPRNSRTIRAGTIRLVLESPVQPSPRDGREAEQALRDTVRSAIERHFTAPGEERE